LSKVTLAARAGPKAAPPVAAAAQLMIWRREIEAALEAGMAGAARLPATSEGCAC
jgi:hypothetical protein